MGMRLPRRTILPLVGLFVCDWAEPTSRETLLGNVVRVDGGFTAFAGVATTAELASGS